MMIPVAVDSSIFIVFAKASCFGLLSSILQNSYDPVLTTPGVVRELTAGRARARAGSSDVRDVCRDWLAVERPARVMASRNVAPDLSPVDRQLLALALERGARVATNDGTLRDEATARGLRAIGTLGLLEAATMLRLADAPTVVQIVRTMKENGLRLDAATFALWRERIERSL